MNNQDVKLSLRSTILAAIYLFNSLVLYVSPIYDLIYTKSYYTYVCVCLLVLASLSMTDFRYNSKTLIICILIFVTGYVDTQINYLPIGELFPLVWFLALIYLFSQLSGAELENPLFRLTNRMFWGFLIVYAIVNKDRFFGEVLEDGILNPNTVGCGIAQFALLGEKTKKNNRCTSLLIFSLSVIGIYLCDARAALLIYIFVAVFSYRIRFKGIKHLKIVMVAIVAVIALGFALPFLYIQLWHRLGVEARFLGKSLFTGRERIWDTLFEYMQSHPLSYIVGTGKVEELFWHEQFNLHNSYLAVFSQLGLLVSILLWSMLLYILFRRLSEIHNIGRVAAFYHSRLETVQNAISYVLFSLLMAYTETNYTYILSIIYIAFAYGALARSDYNDTKGYPLLLVWRE